MSTRSSTRNLVPPLEEPERSIRRTRVDPNPFEEINMAATGAGNDGPPPARGGDQPVPDFEWSRNSITTFDQMAKKFLRKYFPPSMVTKLRNDITNFCQEPDESLFKAWERYNLSIDRSPNHNMLPITQIDTFYNGLTMRHRDTINAAA
ncbi:reverse transcriptase domain-containing protein, partial [Tanacetum coccineum]